MKRIIALATILFLSISSFAQLDRSNAPKPQPNKPFELTMPDVWSFENGLKVLVVENHKLPKVSFQLFIDYPLQPEGMKAGLSDLYGQMLSAGTTSTPKDQFDAKIDYIGADLFTNSRGFYASSLKKHTPVLLGLISEMITSPAFPEDELERLKKQTISGLASEKNDAGAISNNIIGIANYGATHPYGEVVTEKTIESIEISDIKAYYDKFFNPNQAYLIIVGDVTKDEVKGYVNDYFLGWKKGEDIRATSFVVPPRQNNNVYFSSRPGAVQSVIKITQTVDIKPGAQDALALSVLNQILGGGSFSARLMSNLREDKAYTYGCYSSISPDPYMGEFTAGGSFRNEVSDSAITQILFEINKICSEEVLDEELELAKNSMTGSFARSLENPQTIARFALNTARYNLPNDYYATYLQRLDKITKKDLMMVATKYLDPSKFNIVVVGNEEIVENLKQFDADGNIVMKNHYGQDAQSLKKVAEGITAESIINGYVMKYMNVESMDAVTAKLAKIGYIEEVMTAHMEAMGADITMINYAGTPNKTASILKVNSAQGNMTMQKEYFNGEAGGTFVMGAGKTTYEGDELEAKKEPNFPISQLYYFTNKKLKVELLGIDVVNDKEYYKIKVTKEGEDDIKFEYYGVESGLLEITEAITTDDEGNTQTVMVEFGDYKLIKKGLFMPHKMTINAGEQQLNFITQSVTVKKKPKSTAFNGVFE